MKNEKIKKYVKITMTLAIALFSIFIVRSISLNQVRTWVEQFGAYGSIVYILLFSILPIFFFPVPVLALVSGIVFGVFRGTLYTLIGAVINTSIMYFLSRYIGKEYFIKLMNTKFRLSVRKRLMTKDQKSLTIIFFMLRLVPLVSYNMINYVAGLTEIRFINYLFVTILGILPGTVVFLNVGDKSLNMNGMSFYIALALLFALSALSIGLLRVYFKREKNGNHHHTDLSGNSKY